MQFRPKVAQSWRQVFYHHGGWIAILGAVVLAILTGVSAWQYAAAASLNARAERVDVEIVSVGADLFQREDIFVSVRGSGSKGSFAAKYRVKTLSDLTRRPGDIVPMYVVWDDPPYVLRALPDPADAGAITEMAALFVGVITLGFGGNAAIRTTGAVRARRYGRIGTARVVGKDIVYRWKWERLLAERYFWEADAFVFRADSGKRRLRFEDDAGRSNQSLPHEAYVLSGIEPGDEITVYQGLRASWWEGDVGTRADVPRRLPKVRAGRAG